MYSPFLTFLAIVLVVSGNRSRRDCRYEFNVWTPNENEQRRLERIEVQFSNVTNYVDKELARFELARAQESADFRNWSYMQERALSDLKTEQLQKYTELQELQIQFGLFEMNVDRLKIQMGNSYIQRDKASTRNRKDRMVPNHSSQSDTPRHHMLENLKQLVADLKAEWILLKRDFIDIKKENAEIHTRQDGIHDTLSTIEKTLNNVESRLNGMQTLSVSSITNVDIPSVLTQIAQLNKSLASLERAHERFTSEVNKHESALTSLQESSIDMRRGLGDLQTSVADLEKSRNTNDVILSAGNYDSIHTVDSTHPKDCQDIASMGYRTSGAYKVKSGAGLPLDTVYCEMNGNLAYTIIQRRVDGLQNFNRGWLEYKFGFGNVYGEFWLGNEHLHALTTSGKYLLRIDILDWEGNQTYAEYDKFSIADEKSRYELHVSGYHGNAGDSLSYHNNMKFSTKDLDNDIHSRNCASENKGGWWFNGCYFSHLNGVYHVGWYTQAKFTFADGIVWYTLKNSDRYSLRKVEMKLRRVED